MEITISDTVGFPDNATLSLRVGDTRRLQACQDGPTQLRFPSFKDTSSFSFDLFQKVSSQHISLQDWQREGFQDTVERITLHSFDSSRPPMSASVKYSLIHPQSAPSKPKRSRHQVTLEAKSYLDQHGVQEIVQGLLHDVLKHHPANPIDFMMEYLENSRSKSQGSKIKPESKDAFQPPSRPSQGVKSSQDVKAEPLTEEEKSAGPNATSVATNASSIDLEAARQKAKAGLDRGIESGKLNQTLANSTDKQTKDDPEVAEIRSAMRDVLESSVEDGSLIRSVNEAMTTQTPPTTAGDPSAAIGSLPSTAEGADPAATLYGVEDSKIDVEIEELRNKALDILNQGVSDGSLHTVMQSEFTKGSQDEPKELAMAEAEAVTDARQEMINGLSAKLFSNEPLHVHCPFESMPGLNSEDYPGFPADKCPDTLPGLKKHHSIITDILKADPDLYAQLKDLETRNGVTLSRCIKTGIDNPGHALIKAIGCVAGDEESYEVFHELFDRAIDRWHDGWKPNAVHPTDLDVGKLTNVQIDPTGKYVLSARVRAGRSIQGLRLPPACDRSERRECERLVSRALLSFTDNLKGDYYPLRDSWTYAPKPGGMSFEEELELKKDDFLFQEPDSIMTLCTGMGRNWPEARGVFASHCKRFVVWVNEEEHLRLVSMDVGGDLQQVFTRFVQAVNSLEEALEKDGYGYMHNDHLGYILSCPANLGTGLRASVILKIPLVSAMPAFRNLCKSLGLEVRTAAVADISGGGVWDVANLKRLGISEVESINQVILGCVKLVELEQMLERGEAIDDVIEALASSPKAAKQAVDP